jgi:uncharacterized protein (TIGR00251 family)
LTTAPSVATLLEATSDGCRLLVRLTPKSSRDAIEEIDILADGRSCLKARVRAVPEKGKANQALLKLLAGKLGLPISALAISSGSASRLKTIHVAASPADISRKLDLGA